MALVDTKGVIVFIGHPGTRKNLEGDIDSLLKGEPLPSVQHAAEDSNTEHQGMSDNMRMWVGGIIMYIVWYFICWKFDLFKKEEEI